MSEFETEVEVECTCPKCGHKFKETQVTTIEIEPPERDEDG